jgi:hypothetical protein
LVGASDFAKVGSELTAAIGQIRSTQLSCVVKLPAPPPDAVLDPKKVNVQVTSGAGAKAAIKQSQGCADGAGWEYDNPAKPSRIKLCDAACTRIKNDQKSKIDVVLGCDTLVVVN